MPHHGTSFPKAGPQPPSLSRKPHNLISFPSCDADVCHARSQSRHLSADFIRNDKGSFLRGSDMTVLRKVVMVLYILWCDASDAHWHELACICYLHPAPTRASLFSFSLLAIQHTVCHVFESFIALCIDTSSGMPFGFSTLFWCSLYIPYC